MSPILPPEVISKILPHLGKSDLLTCRLVSRSWYQESTFLLHKSTTTCIYLKANHIGHYVNFVEQAKFQISPLRLHLDYFDIGFYPWTSTHSDLDELSALVDQLNSFFGSDIVKKLTLTSTRTKSSIRMESLAKVLSKVSAGLECFKLIDCKLTHCAEANERLDEDWHSLTLPKLKKCYLGEASIATSKLLEMCTNLNYLKINKYGGIGIPACKNLFQTITKLHLRSAGYAALLQDIQSCSPFVPQIQEFKLLYRVLDDHDSSEQVAIVEQILKSFAHSLKSLTIIASPYVLLRPISLPKLPTLQHLKVKLNMGHCPSKETRINLFTARALDPTNLPSLTSLDLPFNCNFVVANFNNNQRHPAASPIRFPSVTSVSFTYEPCGIRRKCACSEFEWNCIKAGCRRLIPLLALFPNAAANNDLVVLRAKIHGYKLQGKTTNVVKYFLAKQVLDLCMYYGNEVLETCRVDEIEIASDCYVVEPVQSLLKELESEPCFPPKVRLGKSNDTDSSLFHQDELKSLIDKFESKRLQRAQ